MSDASNSSWAPDEPPAALTLEHVNFRGLVIIAVSYGFFLAVAMAALYFLIFKPTRKRLQWGLIAYVVAITAGATIYLGPQTKWNEQMFIDDRNIPGGPDGWYATQSTQWRALFSTAAYIFNNFLADGMMLYRCALIWNWNWFVIIIPGLWLAASTVLSILTVVEGGANVPFKFNFALAYFPLSMALNIFLALLIAGKLYWARYKLRGALGSQHGQIYGSIASMIIESASLYSITSLAYIILYGTNNPAAIMILGLVAEVMCISPVLIILRVAYGHGISQEVVAATSNAIHSRSQPKGRTGGSSRFGVTVTTDTLAAADSSYEWKSRSGKMDDSDV